MKGQSPKISGIIDIAGMIPADVSAILPKLDTRITRFRMFACHHRPDRSFFWRGKPFPVCARCTGLYAGYAAGAVLFWWLPADLRWGLLALPLAVDGYTQYRGWRTSTNTLRFLTGFPAGIGVVLFSFSLARILLDALHPLLHAFFQ